MAGLIEEIDQRTRMAGHNRMELLMFFLGEKKQRFGINVFKVQEVIQCPALTKIPKSNEYVRGIADIRGRTIPVIDLGLSIGLPEIEDPEKHFLIVAEYNQSVQGFLVSGVDRIVNMNWEEIKPPPTGIGRACYLTAVTQVNDQFVEIIDVEKVLSEIALVPVSVSSDLSDASTSLNVGDHFILIVDDSLVARNQIKKPLDELGIGYEIAKDGREALNMLTQWLAETPEKIDNLAMVISDVEMPNMDGYTLVTSIRKDPGLKHLYILLHSSLSGMFNNAMVEQVGADRFVAKYDPNVLSGVVLEKLAEICGRT